MESPKSPIILIVGPTAVGKTQMAIELSEIFSSIEVISADSRQIFKHMNIGTAKPSIEELQSVPHHFIDIKNPDGNFNAGDFGIQGRSIFFKLIEEGKIPIVVGGSGLYIRSLVDGLFQGEVRNNAIKKALQKRIESEGLEKLYKELKQFDPEAAQKIHENDQQRIIRALEVWEITGEPISKLRKELKTKINLHPLFIGLNRNREKLYKIINDRVDLMIKHGLIEEVKALRAKGFHSSFQSQKTVGYQEIHNYLNGFIDEIKAIELIKRNTRRFAKRQLTWFNQDKRINWFHIDEVSGWNEAKNHLKRFQTLLFP